MGANKIWNNANEKIFLIVIELKAAYVFHQSSSELFMIQLKEKRMKNSGEDFRFTFRFVNWEP